MLPQLANGDSNTFWVIPSEFTAALDGVSRAFGQVLPAAPHTPAADHLPASADRTETTDAVAEALAAAAQAERIPIPFTPAIGHNGSPPDTQ